MTTILILTVTATDITTGLIAAITVLTDSTDAGTTLNMASTTASTTASTIAGDMENTTASNMANIRTGTATGIMANVTVNITSSETMTGPVTGLRPMVTSAILGICSHQYPAQGNTGGIVLNKPGQSTGNTAVIALPADNPVTDLHTTQQQNQALEQFFISSEEKAFYIAYAALWDREAAMDAVQDSMTRLVEYYREKPAGEWPALFRTILNSKINDVRRRRMIEQGKHRLVSLTGLFMQQDDSNQATTEYELAAQDRDDGITGPEAAIVASELRSKVAGALQSLSERQRQVFILREWRGLSIRETAATLGCSGNSVKQHHFRALRELRTQLAEVWDYAESTSS